VKLRLVFLLIVLSALFAAAQTRKLSPKDLPPSAFKLVSVRVTGTTRYTPEEITEISGLKLGQTFTNDDFKAATERLGESGAFSDVAYSFQYATDGTKLTFQLTETDKLVATRFDNIVWYSDEELVAKLHDRVPLFHGQLPVAGKLPDQVSDALQALMVERGVSGRVDYLRSAQSDGPIDAIVYSIKGPDIRIRNIDFTGASPAELSALEAAAKRLEDTDYLRSLLRVQEDRVFLPIYLGRGYLKSSFGEAQAKVIGDSSKPTLVDVTFPVVPGLEYKVDTADFSGETAFAVEKLRPLIHLQPGQPANAVQLQDDILAIKKLYGTKGYMEVAIDPVAQMDDTRSTVKYQIQIREGDVFKMGELTVEGLDTQTTARLVEDWRLRGGDPYDATYPQKFLEDTAKELKGMGSWNTIIRESVDNKDKVVDVTLRYDPKPK
jgi:outer membrane protein assembly factor BamA